jgi:hypothetical protein
MHIGYTVFYVVQAAKPLQPIQRALLNLLPSNDLLHLLQVQRLMLDQRPGQPLQLYMLLRQKVRSALLSLLDKPSDLALDGGLSGRGDGRFGVAGVGDRTDDIREAEPFHHVGCHRGCIGDVLRVLEG